MTPSASFVGHSRVVNKMENYAEKKAPLLILERKGFCSICSDKKTDVLAGCVALLKARIILNTNEFNLRLHAATKKRQVGGTKKELERFICEDAKRGGKELKGIWTQNKRASFCKKSNFCYFPSSESYRLACPKSRNFS